MSLIFSDGLDSGLSKFNGNKSAAVTWNPTGGVYGGGCIQFPAGGADAYEVQWFPYPTTYTDNTNPITRMSYWFRTDASVTTMASFMYFQYIGPDISNATYAPMNLSTAGKLVHYNWDNAFHAVSYYSSAAANYSRIDDGNWHHIELGLRYSNTLGYYELSIDGSLIFASPNYDNVDGSPGTNPPLLNTIYFRNLRNGNMFIDDVMVWNEYNTNDNFYSRIGLSKIYTLRPVADTVQADSTPSSGSDRYLMLNEPTLNTANYVTISSNGKDYYEMANVANISGQVIGLQATMYCSSANAGYMSNVRPVLVSNGTTSNGNVIVSVTKTATESTYRVNKDFGNGNASWTEGTLNSLLVGFENTG